MFEADSRRVPAHPESNDRKALWIQAAAILLAAVALGFAYNTASPLGVRAAPEPVSSGAARLPSLVAWPQVKPWLAANRAVFVDARNTAAFEAGHIPGALSLPLADLSSRIEAFSTLIPKSQALVVYCDSAACPASEAEARALREKYGYWNVSEMPGGYAEWLLEEPAAAPERRGTP